MYNDWFDDAGNLIILGRSQTGKTVTAREIQDNGRVSIWVNETGDDRVPDVPRDNQRAYRSLRGLENALSRNERNIEFVTDDRNAAIENLHEWLWKKAEMGDRRVPFQVVCDEIHRVAPQSGKEYGNLPPRDRVRDFMKEGMKRNIKFVGITQDPVSFDKESLRQREYMIVMELAHEQKNYMADYGVDARKVAQQPDYSGVLYHASGETMKEGVKARGKYA